MSFLSKPLPPIQDQREIVPKGADDRPLDEKPTFISVTSPIELSEGDNGLESSDRVSHAPIGWWKHRFHYLGGKSNHGWRPATFSGPILSCFVIFSILIIVLLEVLSWKTLSPENGGGLVFAEDIESFSAASSFIFLYLPIIVAVIYSMMWSWVDLDAKRLEPWFQLSKEGGSTARDSLFLQYPFDFLPLVPFKALRKRHWGVFFSGTIMLIIFWLITPLQPAIFNTGVVTRNFHVDLVRSGTVLPLAAQLRAMNSKLLHRAYGMAWLGQALPPYTTREFASLPFGPLKKRQNMLPSETWEATTETFSTSLSCKSVEPLFLKNSGYQFDNGEGCVSSFAIPDINPKFNTGINDGPIERYLLMYIGWDNDAHVSYAFGGPNCTREHSNQYLAIFATAEARIADGQYSDIQIMFCKPRYTIQETTLTVNASSGAVLNYKHTGKISSKPMMDIFNTTLFEYILGAGVNPGIKDRVPGFRDGDFPDTDSRVEQYSRVVEAGLKWPLTNMVGFAAGLNAGPLRDLGDPNALQRLFQTTHQVLFTSAFSVLTKPNTIEGPSDIIPGSMSDKPAAIILVRSIAIIVEVAFGLVGLLAAAFWFVSSRRPSKLLSDPGSLADIIALVPTEYNLANDFKGNDHARSPVTVVPSEQQRYQLKIVRDLPPSIAVVYPRRQSECRPEEMTAGFQDNLETKAIRPTEHRTGFGLMFVGSIMIASTGLIFLQRRSEEHDGINLPSNNPVVRSIIQNYAPTAFATLLEPVWLILSRLLCLLKPFEVLRLGGAKVSQSIGLKYTSIPPQLAIWRALRAKHFLLAIVCFVTVSTSFLAVTLAGLLNEGLTDNMSVHQASQNWLPSFNNTSSSIFKDGGNNGNRDHLYTALSYYGSQNALPPWLDSQYYYIPFELRKNSDEPNNTSEDAPAIYHASTFGMAARPGCSILLDSAEATNAPDMVTFSADREASMFEFFTSHLRSDGLRTRCRPLMTTADSSSNSTFYKSASPPGLGEQAMEVLEEMYPDIADASSSAYENDNVCNGYLVAGWVRLSNTTSANHSRTLQKKFVGCRPIVEYARFNVSVDASGRVLGSNRTSPFTSDADAIFVGENATAHNFFAQLAGSIASNVAGLEWHNVTLSGDWFNHFLKLRSQSIVPETKDPGQNLTALLDPNSPLPNMTFVAKFMDEIYNLIFTIVVASNPDGLLSRSPVPISVEVEVRTQTTKLFVSKTMFILSLTILVAHVCVAFAYYVLRPKRFLTSMPTSIASVIAYVSSSRAQDDFVPGHESEFLRGEDGNMQRYGYGRYIGKDGKTHVGIERMRYVIPLAAANTGTKTSGFLNMVRWRGGKTR